VPEQKGPLDRVPLEVHTRDAEQSTRGWVIHS
ncbi:unnamed protein product, partial [Tuber aestivum]